MAENATLNGSQRGGLFTELGVTGLRHWGGLLDEEFLREWQADRKARTIREMTRNDSVVGATLFAIEMLLRQVTWTVQPASEDPEALDVAEFVRQVLFEDMSHSWEETLAEILTFLPWGWSVVEIVYKRRQGESRNPAQHSKFTDGRIGIRKLAPRAQETLDEWVFDDDGGIQGMKQWDQVSGHRAIIPIEKALLFRTSQNKNSPEGMSVLRWAYAPYRYKRTIEQTQAIGVVRDLAGLPVAYGPPEMFHATATTEHKAVFEALKRIVTNIHRDEQEGVVFPLVYDQNGNVVYKLELLSTGGARQFDTKGIIEYYDRRICGSVLADVIVMGHEKVGSFALADSKTSLLGTALGAWAKSVAGVLNRHCLPRLLRLNGLALDLLPSVEAGDVEHVDIAEFANGILRLSQAGMDLSDVPTINRIRTQVGLPEVDEDTLLEQQQQREALEQQHAQREEAQAPEAETEAGMVADEE